MKYFLHSLAKILTGVCCLLMALTSPLVYAQLNNQEPAFVQDIGVTEHLGHTIPGDLVFAKANGDSVRLADLLHQGKPVILNPLYYECPVLCGLVIDGLFDAVNELAWEPGKEFDIISLSIDPSETDTLAARVKRDYIESGSWGSTRGTEQHRQAIEQVNQGWHFLTGKQPAIDSLISAVGFGVAPIPGTKDFAHSAAIILLSPDGTITRYLYGLRFDSFDFRTAILEASEGTIGNTVDKLIMYCYQYDPNSNSYAPVARRIMSLGGLATLIFLGIFLGYYWLRESRKNQSITN